MAEDCNRSACGGANSMAGNAPIAQSGSYRCGARRGYELVTEVRHVIQGTLEVCFAQRSSQALEFAIIDRHGEQMVGKVRSLKNLETLEALVLFGSHHNDGGFSMFSHGLRFAAGGLDNLAEAIFGISYRPISTGHGLHFLARISV